MDISLTRTVIAKSYKVLATVNIDEDRPDIQNILMQVQKGLKLPPRLISFLTASGLYHNDEITPLGEQALVTGSFPSKERGIYEVWYIEDDYFGKMPVAMQRIEESSTQHGKNNRSRPFHNWSQVEKPQPSLKLNITEARVFLINENKSRDISDLKIEVMNRGDRSKSVQTTLKLEAPSNKANSQWSIIGKIPVDNRGVQKSIDFEFAISEQVTNQLITELCEHLEFTWNEKGNRAAIGKLEKIKYLLDFNIRSLSINDVDTMFGNFKQGSIKNLAIMPKDMKIALDWQEQWLHQLYKIEHVSCKSMEYQQRVWLSHTALKKFELPILLDQELLSKLDGERRNNEVYWHATASHYLVPQLTKQTLPSITFTDNQVISVGELLRQLTLNHEIQSFIYSDRHYKSKLHKNNLQAIAQQAEPNSGFVFTTDPNVSVPAGWDKELISNNRNNHDRYYIFISNMEVFSWKCSTSLDFADLTTQNSFTKGNCTFTRMREGELPQYLQDCLYKMNEEVAA